MISKESAVIRNNPVFELTLYSDRFEIKDETDKDGSGTYSYTELKKIEIKKAEKFWLYATIFLIIDLFTGSTITGKKRLKNRIKMNHFGRDIVISLDDCDLEKVEHMIVKIQKAIKLK